LSDKPTLFIAPCSHAAARYAVEHWHYSHRMPAPKYVLMGVWEDAVFIGVVVFSRGATEHLGKPYGLTQDECCELTRVALRDHQTPVSRILSIALRELKKTSPGMRLVVSFADPHETHHGGIYQALGACYAGRTKPMVMYEAPDGKVYHPRVISITGQKKQFGVYKPVWKPAQCRALPRPGKYRYLLPLDAAMRAQIEPLRQPYPKRVGSSDSAVPGLQPGEGGASPTSTLQLSEAVA